MRRLYRKPNKGLIGVDISSTSVKVLELSVKSGRYWVESYALIPLSENSVVEKNILNPEAVADALGRAINLGNTQSNQAAFAIPTSMVITKIIEMDADMSDDEREVQIREDAEQYIPFHSMKRVWTLKFCQTVFPIRTGSMCCWSLPESKMSKHVLKF